MKKQSTDQHPAPPPRRPTSSSTVEVIDPRWILRALGVVIAAAMLCAYFTLCLLYWQGQWQIVLHPLPKLQRDPSALGLAFEEVHFGVDASGAPQLAGWWIPASSAPAPTVLLLHGLSGNRSNALERAQMLHSAGLNVFVFDYRGYGDSNGPHPTQDRIFFDAGSALDYLIQSRKLSASSVIVDGEADGAPVAVHLAAAHPELPAILLFDPAGDLGDVAARDPRSRFVPALLFRERFPLAHPLKTLATPKLIVGSPGTQQNFDTHSAADPKMIVTLALPRPDEPQRSLQRFLDSYINRTGN